MNKQNLQKLLDLKNKYAVEIVKKYIDICKPDKVTILSGTPADNEYVRQLSINTGEEHHLSTPGHTYHFDGLYDQGRDKEQTKVLLPEGQTIGKHINTGNRKSCLTEIFELLNGSMKGKEMLILFYCLGPLNSRFSIPALQITDSAYVAHGENILYRPGYEEFKKLAGSADFFHFVHSSGELVNKKTGPISKNSDKKRIYIDLVENRVFSVNTQYAGNSVGLKKLALRLAIKKSSTTDWLCEHMLIIGAKPQGKNRVTYFTGAYPSACGKTSTAMIPGQSIIGDDIAYIKPGSDGKAYAVNVEKGIFGIISDINEKDDPLISKVLTSPRELIFSNVLIKDKTPYWLGMGKDLPKEGLNYSGFWKPGNKDQKGNEIKAAHPNARYTISIDELPNIDPRLEDPNGVPVSGIIYGGRDTDTSPPVVESFNWAHGVFMGAALESETTSATIGEVGIRKHNPMANLDFMVVPLSLYIENHLKFGAHLQYFPVIFTVNYFLKEKGEFITGKVDKKVWLMWMEGRIHQDFGAIETPIGFIPRYEDLHRLFMDIFRRDYTKEEYGKQFAIRKDKLLDKLDRIEKIFRDEKDIPAMIFHLIKEQRNRLNNWNHNSESS